MVLIIMLLQILLTYTPCLTAVSPEQITHCHTTRLVAAVCTGGHVSCCNVTNWVCLNIQWHFHAFDCVNGTALHWCTVSHSLPGRVKSSASALYIRYYTSLYAMYTICTRLNLDLNSMTVAPSRVRTRCACKVYMCLTLCHILALCGVCF